MRRAILLLLLMLPATARADGLQWGMERRAKILAEIELSFPRPELCRAACAARPGCASFTYVRPGWSGRARPACRLLEEAGRPRARICCAAGMADGRPGTGLEEREASLAREAESCWAASDAAAESVETCLSDLARRRQSPLPCRAAADPDACRATAAAAAGARCDGDPACLFDLALAFADPTLCEMSRDGLNCQLDLAAELRDPAPLLARFEGDPERDRLLAEYAFMALDEKILEEISAPALHDQAMIRILALRASMGGRVDPAACDRARGPDHGQTASRCRAAVAMSIAVTRALDAAGDDSAMEALMGRVSAWSQGDMSVALPPGLAESLSASQAAPVRAMPEDPYEAVWRRQQDGAAPIQLAPPPPPSAPAEPVPDPAAE